MNNRLPTLTWLLILVLFLGAADESTAGRKKKKKKKNKEKAAASETTGQPEESSSTAAPPKVVKDIEKRLLAYDTSAARGLLGGQQLDSNVHLKIAEGRILEQGVDLDKRRQWPEYMAAYEDVLTRCSTAEAPWWVIPADQKWYRNLAISRILVNALRAMDLRFPDPEGDLEGITIE